MYMRQILVSVVFALAVVTPAAADQTDTRLDQLFEDLRTGAAIDADVTADRIVEIWSDAQSDTVDILYMRALAQADEGNNDLAGALLDHAIGLSPNFMQGYALRGIVRLASLDQEGAIADFSKALELEPRQFEVRIALAEILISNNEHRAAYDMLQKALEWNPHEKHARERASSLRRKIDGQEI